MHIYLYIIFIYLFIYFHFIYLFRYKDMKILSMVFRGFSKTPAHPTGPPRRAPGARARKPGASAGPCDEQLGVFVFFRLFLCVCFF